MQYTYDIIGMFVIAYVFDSIGDFEGSRKENITYVL